MCSQRIPSRGARYNDRRLRGSDLNKELDRVHAHWALSARGRPQTVRLEADRDDARQEAQRKAGEHVPGARLTQDTRLVSAVTGNLPGAANDFSDGR
jgi:hypothetical protein